MYNRRYLAHPPLRHYLHKLGGRRPHDFGQRRGRIEPKDSRAPPPGTRTPQQRRNAPAVRSHRRSALQIHFRHRENSTLFEREEFVSVHLADGMSAGDQNTLRRFVDTHYTGVRQDLPAGDEGPAYSSAAQHSIVQLVMEALAFLVDKREEASCNDVNSSAHMASPPLNTPYDISFSSGPNQETTYFGHINSHALS